MIRNIAARKCACIAFALACAFTLSGVGIVEAQVVTYTFEPPNFAAGQTTPLLNRNPNAGFAAFAASFTALPTANGFIVDAFVPNPLFSGLCLFDPSTPADTLSVALNTPVTRVEVDFATISPGRLNFNSPSGITTQNSAPVGGTFQGGTLVFSSPLPFAAFSLAAFDNAGAPTLFAIDDLTMTVPEPACGLALCASAGGAVITRRRRAPART